MSKELEIEFRNMITAEEYQELIESFGLKEADFFEQTNYYFDTPTFALKELHAALRIRARNNNYELTLKTPEKVGLLETTQILAPDQAEGIIAGANIPVGQIRDALAKLSIDHTELENFGSLQTIRAEKDYKNGLLVFDKNFYGNIADFDLEYEVADFEKGKKIFSNLLEDYGIEENEAPNKVKRFYDHIYGNK